MPAEREIVNQPEVQRGPESHLSDVRTAAYTPGDTSSLGSAISMDKRIDTINEFNATFDPKNNAFSAEEINKMLHTNIADMAATQKMIEARLQSLGFTMDKDMASQWLTSHHGEDVQITGLDNTKK